MTESETAVTHSKQPLDAKQWKWLNQESNHWVSAGLISTDQAQRISSQYALTPGKSWVMYLLSAVGAIVFGLGVILMFAYNWAELTKPIKLSNVLGALLLAHGTALFLRLKRSSQMHLIEGFHMLGTMMLGAGIWLIAQVYHIDEHYPTAFALWGAGALLLAWALPSILQSMVATILLIVWGSTEIMDFNGSHYYALLALFFGVLPLAWSLKSQTVLLTSLAGIVFLMLANLGYWTNEELMPYLLMASSTLLLFAAYFSHRTSFPKSGGVFRLLGIALYGSVLFVFSAQSRTNILFSNPAEGVPLYIGTFALVIALVCVITCIKIIRRESRDSANLIELIIICTSLLLCLTALHSFFESRQALGVTLFSIILISHCILLIITGVNNVHWKNVAVGCTALSALIFWQFSYLFHSLLMRSAAFLTLGFVLFLIGHVYAKSKQSIDAEDSSHA